MGQPTGEQPRSQPLEGSTDPGEAGPARSYTAVTMLAFVTAVTLVVLVHELSHVLAGLLLGYENTLYPFGVTHHPDPSTADAAVAALTGPVFSLVTGAILMAWQPLRTRRGYGQLLWLFVAWVSFMEGVGYLLLTPFGIGDTGSTAAAYGVSVAITAPLGALGVLGTIWLAMRFAVPLLRHTDGSLAQMRSVAFYPWMIGTAMVLALTAAYLARAGDQFGAGDVFGVLMGAFALGVWAPMSLPFTTRARRADPALPGSEPLTVSRVPVLGVLVLVVLVAVNLVLLGPGLSIG